MKKILLACVGLLGLFLQSCYDDYKTDFEFTSTYFSLQTPLRTLVMEDGKDLSFEVGVVLSGKYTNDQKEVVDFSMPSTMLDGTGLELLPSSYYEISNTGQFVIEKGTILGTVKITLTDDFVNDPLAHTTHYALPFKITDASVDSVLAGKDSTIVAVKYQNKYYGAYWLKGVDYTLDDTDAKVDTFKYSEEDLVSNLYFITETTAKDTTVVKYLGADKSGNNSLKMGIKDDGSLVVLAHNTKAADVITDVAGTGKYDKENKIITLDYIYVKDAVKHQVKDTLYHFDTPMSVETWFTGE